MLSINISELIWTIINFFLLYFLLKRFLFDPVLRFTDARREKIDAGLNEEKRAQETVEANRERLAAEMAERRLEASRILTDAEAEDARVRSESLNAARRQAAEDLRESAARLERQNERDETLLKESGGELSSLLAARILGQEE